MVNSVLIFILLPLVVGFLLLLLSAKRKLTVAISSFLALALVIIAFSLPQDLVFEFRGSTFEVQTSLILLGRAFSLPANFFSFCALFYIIGLLWAICSPLFRLKYNFPAMALLIPALMVAMIAVDPFLYSAVIFEIVALLAIPLLLQKETRSMQGLLHFLILQTLAMALVLLSSWMLAGASTAQISNPMILRGAAMVLFGFILWLPVFPFHVWIGELFAEHHPWPVSLLLTGMQAVFPVLLLVFLDKFAWLRNLPSLFVNIRIFGSLIIALAGVFASFQRNFRRQTAYLYLNETGYSLLIIGMAAGGNLRNLVLLMLPRVFSFWFWSYCLSVLETRFPQGEQDLRSLNGFIKEEPLLSLGMVLSQLSLMGTPLLALFPIKRLIWFELPFGAMTDLIPIGIGLLGMVAFTLRMLMAMLTPKDPEKFMPGAEADLLYPRISLGVLLIGMLALLVLGLMPQLFGARFLEIIGPYLQLGLGLSQ